jgi:transketolase
MRDAFNDELYNIAASNPNVLLLTADIGFKVFDRFRAAFNDRFINMGVAEPNMLGVAAGLALSGKYPVVYTIIPFLTMRAFEQIRVDVCMQNQPVKIVGVGGGVAYGHLGPTHHSLEDVAILRSLPNMTVLVPCDPLETRKAVRAAFEHPGPVYIRLGKNGEPSLYHNEFEYQIGRAVLMREGTDATIVVSGPVARLALEVAELLARIGISIRILDMHSIKPMDQEAILKAVQETKAIVTIEEHNIIGGLGSAVAEVIAESGIGISFKRIGIKDTFCHGAGSQEYHWRRHGITSQGITDTIIQFLNRG